ncbi:hypothetical protein SAMN04487907_10210 [Zunongwangia mangrovi]|uniref:Histone deacetylase n=1 Tax=Zunongwangia mangrovi TaxID=1334022 RepID=A0A1I1G256_9FLAO|nr:hypothetical protein [Zunongwangia mangrovi]SFC03260.1 hypothetical protein SAMN04487907_10210 [Zunongwangia mangrovi]
MRNFERVWYACYGSNLMEDRFLCYIAGGTPKGAKRTYTGCNDKALPKANRSYVIDHELYFAKSSHTWSGGSAAFLKPQKDKTAQSFGKIYSISKDQFIDLVKQEVDLDGELSIDPENVIRNGYLDIDADVWYDRILFLGWHQEMPIFSFTNSKFLKEEINAPHPLYLEKIISGLRETYNFTSVEIIKYLENKTGIKQHKIATDLKQLVNEVLEEMNA